MRFRDEVLLAPAKLTVSLRVGPVRADGYHEIDAEMVTLDLADELAVRRGRIGSHGGGGGRRRDSPTFPSRRDNLVARALASCGRTAEVRLAKRIPLGGGLGGGSADAAAVLRWAGCTDLEVAAPPRLGRALLRRRWAGPGPGGGGAGHRRFHSRTVSTCCCSRPSALTPARSTGPGIASLAADAEARAGDAAAERPSPAAALAVEPRLAVWREAFGELAGCEPTLGGKWLDLVRRGRPDRRPGTPAMPVLRLGDGSARLVQGPNGAGWLGRAHDCGTDGADRWARLLAGPPLPAGRLQHLLVLLLAHALPALLDQ